MDLPSHSLALSCRVQQPQYTAQLTVSLTRVRLCDPSMELLFHLLYLAVYSSPHIQRTVSFTRRGPERSSRRTYHFFRLTIADNVVVSQVVGRHPAGRLARGGQFAFAVFLKNVNVYASMPRTLNDEILSRDVDHLARHGHVRLGNLQANTWCRMQAQD